MIFEGGFSGRFDLKGTGGNFSSEGILEANNLTMSALKPSSYAIISNENIDCRFNILFNTAFNTISVNQIVISDDILKLDFTGKYLDNKDKHLVEVKFNSSTIDLSRLSSNVTPYPNVVYKGTLKATADIVFDLKSQPVHF